MAAKPDKVEAYSKGPLSIESFDVLIKLSRDKQKTLYFNLRETLVTELDRVVSFNVDQISITSHNLLITWSHKVT